MKLSNETMNQLKWSEAHNKVIGIRKDYRSSISDNEFEIKLKVTGNEEYWVQKEQITINQSEFNSLGLQFMHFMSPELNYKNNPYKVMKVWVDIGGEEKTQMYGVQQVYKDTIRCKLIGTPEQIEGVIAHKKYEEDNSWEDELEKIRAYSGNDLHKSKKQVKKMANNSGGIEFVEITTLDDYEEKYTYEIHSNWHSYKQALTNSRRLDYLEEQLEKIEAKISLMDPIEKEVYKILAKEYGLYSFDIDERYLLSECAGDIAEKFETHPAEIWKAFWVHIEPWVKKEIEWLENNL